MVRLDELINSQREEEEEETETHVGSGSDLDDLRPQKSVLKENSQKTAS